MSNNEANNNNRNNEQNNNQGGINNFIQQDGQGRPSIGGVPVHSISALEELFAGIQAPPNFGEQQGYRQQEQPHMVEAPIIVETEEEVTPVITIEAAVQRNEDGFKLVWDAENPRQYSGLLILDLFRGYLFRLLENAEAAHEGDTPFDPMPILLAEQSKLNAIFPQVRSAEGSEIVLTGIEFGERLPSLKATKPVDKDYESFILNGSLEDMGVCVHVLMAVFVLATTNADIVQNGIVFFNNTYEGTVLTDMSRNDYIRALKWRDVLGRL